MYVEVLVLYDLFELRIVVTACVRLALFPVTFIFVLLLLTIYAIICRLCLHERWQTRSVPVPPTTSRQYSTHTCDVRVLVVVCSFVLCSVMLLRL